MTSLRSKIKYSQTIHYFAHFIHTCFSSFYALSNQFTISSRINCKHLMEIRNRRLYVYIHLRNWKSIILIVLSPALTLGPPTLQSGTQQPSRRVPHRNRPQYNFCSIWFRLLYFNSMNLITFTHNYYSGSRVYKVYKVIKFVKNLV